MEKWVQYFKIKKYTVWVLEDSDESLCYSITESSTGMGPGTYGGYYRLSEALKRKGL